jgi:hypothetical protein
MPKLIRKAVLDAIRQLGSIGGKTAARNMTAEQRRARAKKAAKASAKVRTAKAKVKKRKERA